MYVTIPRKAILAAMNPNCPLMLRTAEVIKNQEESPVLQGVEEVKSTKCLGVEPRDIRLDHRQSGSPPESMSGLA